MSKIVEYRRVKARAESLKRFADRWKDRGRWDKLGAEVVLEDTYQGTYGSSSVSSWDDEIRKAMSYELEQMLPEAAERAAHRAERAALEAAKAAEGEANEVLSVVAGENQ